jgi:hypothetical protein
MSVDTSFEMFVLALLPLMDVLIGSLDQPVLRKVFCDSATDVFRRPHIVSCFLVLAKLNNIPT